MRPDEDIYLPEEDPNDEGSPYAGSGTNYDQAGSTRAFHPGDKVGPRLKVLPKDVVERVGTTGRAPLMGADDSPVQPTSLPFNPFQFMGVVPTRFPTDPTGKIGTSVASTPAHVVLSRLKSKGAEEWMLDPWARDRASRGVRIDADILKQAYLLARFGDKIAHRFFFYAQSLNQRLDEIERRQQMRYQQQARSIGVLRRSP